MVQCRVLEYGFGTCHIGDPIFHIFPLPANHRWWFRLTSRRGTMLHDLTPYQNALNLGTSWGQRARVNVPLQNNLIFAEQLRKIGWNKLVRVDYHGAKEVPKGTCHAILKSAGIKKK